MNIEELPRPGIVRGLAFPCVLCVAAVALLFGASCAMDPEQKPVVELRLDSPPSPEAIPFNDEERETVRKHPEVEESVRAWSNRMFSLEFVGQSITFPVERAFAGIRQGQVVGVTLFSPNLTGDELHHLTTTALRLWKASPEALQRYETWSRGSRKSIVEMQIGDELREVSVKVCPSFNSDQPYVFKCDVWWRLVKTSSPSGEAEAM